MAGVPIKRAFLSFETGSSPIAGAHFGRTSRRPDHINYTKRLLSLSKFDPHDNEVKLYEYLSAYLRRKDTVAFGEKPNQLITLVVRKILGSSTFAVAETLSSIIERLKALKRLEVEDFADIDTAEEIAEEWPSDDEAIVSFPRFGGHRIKRLGALPVRG